MLNWMKGYYKGEGIRNSFAIRNKINHRKAVPEIFLLTFSNNPDNILEIVPAVALIQKTVYDRCPTIIGMAQGKAQAIDLAVKIIEEVFHSTGAFRVEEYFKNR